jgi:hypothetical protein
MAAPFVIGARQAPRPRRAAVHERVGTPRSTSNSGNGDARIFQFSEFRFSLVFLGRSDIDPEQTQPHAGSQAKKATRGTDQNQLSG